MKHQAPVVPRVDTTVREINHYPVNGSVFPFASDLSDGEPILDQLGPATSTCAYSCACAIFHIKSTGYILSQGIEGEERRDFILVISVETFTCNNHSLIVNIDNSSIDPDLFLPFVAPG